MAGVLGIAAEGALYAAGVQTGLNIGHGKLDVPNKEDITPGSIQTKNKTHAAPLDSVTRAKHQVQAQLAATLKPGQVAGQTTSQTRNRAKKGGSTDLADVHFKNMPAIIANEVRFSKPHIEVSKDGCKKTVCHRFQIASPVVASTTGFNVVGQFSLQPGLTMGSWLATEAAGWEQYNMRQLRFHWIPIQGQNADGDINMVLDYNPVGSPPTSTDAASQTQDMVQGSIFVPHTLVARPKDLMLATGKRKWIRTASDFVGDRKTYDCGQFFLISEGVTSISPGARLGKLWVDFICDFYVPQAPGSLSVGFCRASEFFLNTNVTLNSAATTAITPWTATAANNIGVTVDGAGLWTLPRGCYDIEINSNVATNSATASAVTDWILQLNGLALTNNYGGVAIVRTTLQSAVNNNTQLTLSKRVILDLGGPLFVTDATRQFTVQFITPTFSAGTAIMRGNVAQGETLIHFLRIDS